MEKHSRRFKMHLSKDDNLPLEEFRDDVSKSNQSKLKLPPIQMKSGNM
jgi:hypothetical protein